MNKIVQVALAISRVESGSGVNFPDYLDTARAAIEAMRVPTEGMAVAGSGILGFSGDVYTAMIDAALEGK